MMKLLRLAAILLLAGGFGVRQVVLAQDDDCITIVQEALETVGSVCEPTGRNQACYGNRQLVADFLPDTWVTFANPGDIADLGHITRLHTAAFDTNSGAWGIAVLKAQVNLPDTLPGQNVTFLLIGDVTLTTVSKAGAAPMQAFIFATGMGTSQCQNAPDSLVIQSPQGTRVDLIVNGVHVNLGSTAVFSLTPQGSLDVSLVGGTAEITAVDERQTLHAGQTTTIALDNALLATAAPNTPEIFDPTALQFIPFGLLPETVEVSVTVPWTDTGVILHAGDQFTISASGLMNTHSGVDDRYADFHIWTPPTGFPIGDACLVTSLESFDCTYPCAAGEESCPDDVPIMALLGRVGTGQYFVVGAGGTFVAGGDGVLQLGIYEGDPIGYLDNLGAFYAIITINEQSR